MKKLFFIYVCILLLLISCKEPAFLYEYHLNNNNASLYILNHSGNDLSLQLNNYDGTSEERIIKPVKNERIDSGSLYNIIKNKSYVFISYSKIKDTDSDYDYTEDKSFPYLIDNCTLLCNDFGNTNIKTLTIKNEDEILFSSNLEVPQTEPAVTFVHYTPGGYSFENIDKNFNNGDFIFQNRIGNYLFIDFDEIDFTSSTNLSLRNPRYIIVIGEIIGKND